MKPDKAPKLWNELTLSSDKVYQLGLMVSGNKLAYNFPFICLKRWLPAVRERSCVVSSQHVCLKLLCYQCKPYLCMGEHEWPNPNHAFHVNFMNFMQNHFPTLKMKEKICANTTHIIRELMSGSRKSFDIKKSCPSWRSGGLALRTKQVP